VSALGGLSGTCPGVAEGERNGYGNNPWLRRQKRSMATERERERERERVECEMDSAGIGISRKYFRAAGRIP